MSESGSETNETTSPPPVPATAPAEKPTASTRIWTKEAEEAVNNQINAELTANYAYLAMAQYFDRSDVSLKNIAAYFRKSAEEESTHAQQFIDYQNRRGGTVVFAAIQPFNIPSVFTAKMAFEKAKDLEEHVYDLLLKTHDSSINDPELTDEIAGTYLHEQVQSIRELKGYITNLNQVGEGLGTYIFDREFAKSK